MASIQESPFPLVFRVDPGVLSAQRRWDSHGVVQVRTRARALEGMQKEAIVEYVPTGTVWRLVCDEGPWLNGTDLAPFPLAFFTAGLAASFMSEYLAEAADRELRIDALRLTQDNFFTMEGSAVKGTMAAGVEPVQVSISASGEASVAELVDIAEVAVIDRAPANAVLQDTLPSRFAIRANGERVAWSGELAPRIEGLDDPAAMFELCRPAGDADLTPDIIKKAGEDLPADANVAVGLQAEQKRMVHVHTAGRLRDDGLKEISVQCIRPAGSRFVLLSDDSRDMGGQERAPNGLVYLSCGVAFCFMTQLGRYAQIVKQKLRSYRIVQDTAFGLCRNYDPSALPVETLVCLDTEEGDANTRQLVHMAEQTCYLHGAYRIPTETQVTWGRTSTTD